MRLAHLGGLTYLRLKVVFVLVVCYIYIQSLTALRRFMNKRAFTASQFIEKANSIHQNKFDYSQVKYQTQKSLITIICPTHGAFNQTASSHLCGRGCPECAKVSRKQKNNINVGKKFSEKARLKYKGKYNYDQVEWVNRNTEVTILCPVHGDFQQKPFYHLHKNCKGCPKCLEEEKQTRSQDRFIPLAKEAHSGKYDYSLVAFKSMEDKVTIICPQHGEFKQTPKRHLKGQGCNVCGKEKSIKNRTFNLADFLRKAKKIHKDKYNYDLVDYKNAITKVTIVCPKHGKFKQTPADHWLGKRCNRCGVESMIEKQKVTEEEFIKRAKSQHGDRYDYSQIDYQGISHKVSIKCKQHGEFYQLGSDHVRGIGCPKCGEQSTAEALTHTSIAFKKLASLVHEGKYAYPSKYENSKTSVNIICHKHGTFKQRPGDHLDGHGCPACGNTQSQQENRLVEGLLPYFPSLVVRDRSGIAGTGKSGRNLELDIYLPEAKVAVEVSGLYWHSTAQQDRRGRDWAINHHLVKTGNCEKEGVQLITIYEDEIDNRFEAVLSAIKCKANSANDKVFARKTVCKDIAWSCAAKFLEVNHIQGKSKPTKAKGLFEGEELVAVMVLGKSSSIRGKKKEGVFELIRFSSSKRVVGGASKLLKAFIRENPEIRKIISYSDIRISDGNLYKVLGFTCTKTGRPDYMYVHKGVRKHKSNFTRAKLAKLLPDFNPDLTEEANCFNNKIYKIYNCGLQKWELDI